MTLPYVAGSETSEAAADLARPTAARDRDRVLEALVAAGERGLTDEELQQRLGLEGSSERPRRVELVERHLVEDSGRTRPTRSGRRATIWVAVWPGQQMRLL